MQTTIRDFGATAPSVRLRVGVTVVLVAALIGILALSVWQAGQLVIDLDHRRGEALASTRDTADAAGAAAGAFRTLRPTLEEGDRFALVFAPDISRDQRGLYRLVSLSYLYPAIATPDLAAADAVMVFGEPSPVIRDAFNQLGVVDDVWLGRRAP